MLSRVVKRMLAHRSESFRVFQGHRVVNVNPVVGHSSGPNEALWYWEPYGKQVADYVRGKVDWFVDLHGPGAVNSEFKRAVVEVKPTRICGCGHGNENVWTGYRLDKLIWVDCEPERVPAGAEMFVLSCRTAARLGPWLVSSGVKRYLGWRTDYIFWAVYGVRKAEGGASIDWRFLKPIEEAMQRWATGEWTLRQAYEYIYSTYMAAAQDPNLPPDIASTFLWDAQYLTLIEGEAEAAVRYRVALTLPDGKELVLAEGSAPYPQDVYSVTVNLPPQGPEGWGRLTVTVTVKDQTGTDSIPVRLKTGELRVKITKPEPESTLIYGTKVTVEFTVGVA